MRRAAGPGRRRSAEKAAATLAVLVALAALEFLVARGSFDARHDPFPTSVVAPQ